MYFKYVLNIITVQQGRNLWRVDANWMSVKAGREHDMKVKSRATCVCVATYKRLTRSFVKMVSTVKLVLKYCIQRLNERVQ